MTHTHWCITHNHAWRCTYTGCRRFIRECGNADYLHRDIGANRCSEKSGGTVVAMSEYQLSTGKVTILVVCDEQDRIVWAADIARKFEGQPLGNLQRWMRKIWGPVSTTDLADRSTGNFGYTKVG